MSAVKARTDGVRPEKHFPHLDHNADNHRGHRGHRSGFESPKALDVGSVGSAFSVVPFRQTRVRLGCPHSNQVPTTKVVRRFESGGTAESTGDR